LLIGGKRPRRANAPLRSARSSDSGPYAYSPRDVTVIRVPYEPVAATLKLAIQLIQHEVREQGRDGSLKAKDNFFCSGLGWASRYSGYDLRMVRLGGEWHVG